MSARALVVRIGERAPVDARWPVRLVCEDCGKVVRVHGRTAHAPRSWRIVGGAIATCPDCVAAEPARIRASYQAEAS